MKRDHPIIEITIDLAGTEYWSIEWLDESACAIAISEIKDEVRHALADRLGVDLSDLSVDVQIKEWITNETPETK